MTSWLDSFEGASLDPDWTLDDGTDAFNNQKTFNAQDYVASRIAGNNRDEYLIWDNNVVIPNLYNLDVGYPAVVETQKGNTASTLGFTFQNIEVPATSASGGNSILLLGRLTAASVVAIGGVWNCYIYKNGTLAVSNTSNISGMGWRNFSTSLPTSVTAGDLIDIKFAITSGGIPTEIAFICVTMFLGAQFLYDTSNATREISTSRAYTGDQSLKVALPATYNRESARLHREIAGNGVSDEWYYVRLRHYASSSDWDIDSPELTMGVIETINASGSRMISPWGPYISPAQRHWHTSMYDAVSTTSGLTGVLDATSTWGCCVECTKKYANVSAAEADITAGNSHGYEALYVYAWNPNRTTINVDFRVKATNGQIFNITAHEIWDGTDSGSYATNTFFGTGDWQTISMVIPRDVSPSWPDATIYDDNDGSAIEFSFWQTTGATGTIRIDYLRFENGYTTADGYYIEYDDPSTGVGQQRIFMSYDRWNCVSIAMKHNSSNDSFDWTLNVNGTSVEGTNYSPGSITDAPGRLEIGTSYGNGRIDDPVPTYWDVVETDDTNAIMCAAPAIIVDNSATPL